MKERKRRKTLVGSFDAQVMENAVSRVLNGESTIRGVCRLYPELKIKTVARYVQKKRDNPDTEMSFSPKYNHRMVFTPELELLLKEFVMKRVRVLSGVNADEFRKKAYELAVKNNLKIPEAWHKDKAAGKFWMYSFRDRHPDMVLRTPEKCSINRLSAFSKENTDEFFRNLKEVLIRYPTLADGTRIFNLDETGVSTVVSKSTKVFAQKGSKRVICPSAAERGPLVTVCAIISASGAAIPPAIIFPRVNFHNAFLIGAPAGSCGLATVTGWMNHLLFPIVMDHFIRHTRPSAEDPVLLIYDNHESHLGEEVLNKAKDNHVIVLTLPPHCSDRMQPLDVSVNKSFRSSYNRAIENWQLNHPLEKVTIYHLGAFIGEAYGQAFTFKNITHGFEAAGIHPFNDQKFTKEDFLEFFSEIYGNNTGSDVVDIEVPSSQRDTRKETAPISNHNEVPLQRNMQNKAPPSLDHEAIVISEVIATPAGTATSDVTVTPPARIVTPEELFGFPTIEAVEKVNEVAEENRKKPRGRPKGRSAIMTSTPEMMKRQEIEKKREEKKKETENRQRRGAMKRAAAAKKRAEKQMKKDKQKKTEKFKPKKTNPKRKLSFGSTSEDWSSSEASFLESPTDALPEVNDFVLVKFEDLTQSSSSKAVPSIYYTGCIKAIRGKNYKVQFLRRKRGVEFEYPAVEDVAEISEKDIQSILRIGVNETRRSKAVRFPHIDTLFPKLIIK